MSDNTKASLDTAFLYVQEKKLKYLNSNSAIIQNMVKMGENDILGRKFLMPVALSYELGVTFGDGTVYALNDSIAAAYDEIEVDPSPVSLRTRVSQSAANRWKAGSTKSVINNVAIRAGQMKKSLQKFAEIAILHGQTGIGTVSGLNDNGSGTNVLTISSATFCEGIWAGMIGMKLDAYTSTVKQNTTGALTLAAVNFANKTVTVTGANADTAAIDVGSVLYPFGAYANDQLGIKYQLQTSGTVFGISNTTYDLWRANTYPVNGQLTMAHILKGQASAVGRGGLDEDVVLFVNPINWEILNSSLSALRDFDGSYKVEKGENGFKAIKYYGQAGAIDIVSHPYMFPGEAFGGPKSTLRRVGATDIDFMKDDEGGYWRSLDVAGYAGYQATAQYEFQILITEPAKWVHYTAIS
jgi:hypothetical protein